MISFASRDLLYLGGGFVCAQVHPGVAGIDPVLQQQKANNPQHSRMCRDMVCVILNADCS